jgi:hypothetical protein
MSATLAAVHQTFTDWLGPDYDIDALDAVLATGAAEKLTGDPLWLLVISGSGNAKTETVQALAGAGALVTSTITSEGALLSATPVKEKTKDATGGLLRRLGSSGMLVVKDMTSVLSMPRDPRAGVLAALREIYDGKWERNVGTNGGRTLTWTGRIAIVGAVTTAWDRAHEVIASMGDRFVLIRMNSAVGRTSAGQQAMKNTGHEGAMRQALASAVGNVVRPVHPHHALMLTDDEMSRLLRAADVVTLCRTAVDYDYRGNVIDAQAPEMPTRFAKQLVQLVRGGVAVGLSRHEAVRLALRCARDSMPPLRLAILDDVAAHPDSRTGDVRQRLDKPWSTVDRQLQSLHMLGVLTCTEGTSGKSKPSTLYRVAADVNTSALHVPTSSPDLSLTYNDKTEEEEKHLITDISGDEEADHAGVF